MPGFKAEAIDVYETSDLPEADQHLQADTDSGDTVEVLAISPNEAFGRFKGSYIDSKAVDFSDKLRQDRRQGEPGSEFGISLNFPLPGYTVVWTGDPKKDEETPLKKYQRLNCEVRELMEEVRAASSGGAGGGASLDKVSVELEKLHCRLVQLRLEEVTGAEGGHGHLLSGGNIHTAHHLDSSAGCNVTRGHVTRLGPTRPRWCRRRRRYPTPW